MKCIAVDPHEPEHEKLAAAAEVITSGGIVVLPTETVYGVAANVFDEAAVERIFAAKRRPRTKPLAVFIPDREGLTSVVRYVPRAAEPLIEKLWPGPLTLVMYAQPTVPLSVTAATGTIGVRRPDNRVATGVMKIAGVPLACTSANLSGDQEATGVDALAPEFSAHVHLALDAGKSGIGVVSTIVDLTGTAPRLIRSGAIEPEMIEEVMGLKLTT